MKRINFTSYLIGAVIVFIACCSSKAMSEKLIPFKDLISEGKTQDIYLTKPKGFHEVPFLPHSFHVNPLYQRQTKLYSPNGMLYLSAMQSDDKQAMILYPFFNERLRRGENHIEEDISHSLEDENMNVTKCVNIIDLRNSANPFNADKLAIYKFKTPVPFYGLYKYFLGVYLRKTGHPFLLFKIGMTKDGTANADKYLNALLQSVKYGNAVSQYLIANPDTVLANELIFPLKKYPDRRGGILLEGSDQDPKLIIKKAEEGNYDPFER